MNLPQFGWRQILVFSAHQIVIGKELEVCLGNLQAFLLYISAGEDIGVRQHIVVYQLAHNLVRKWAAVAADDTEAVFLSALSVVVRILRRSDAVGKAETDIDACVRTCTHDDALLVFLWESDVLRQFELNLLEELLQGLHILQEDELVAIILCLQQVVIVDSLLAIYASLHLLDLLLEFLILPELVGRLLLAMVISICTE